MMTSFWLTISQGGGGGPFYLLHERRRMFSMIRLADMKSNFNRVLNSSPYLQFCAM